MGVRATEYVKHGNMLILRDALPYSDPESWEALWKAEYGALVDFPFEQLKVRKFLPDDPAFEDRKCPCCGRAVSNLVIVW